MARWTRAVCSVVAAPLTSKYPSLSKASISSCVRPASLLATAGASPSTAAAASAPQLGATASHERRRRPATALAEDRVGADAPQIWAAVRLSRAVGPMNARWGAGQRGLRRRSVCRECARIVISSHTARARGMIQCQEIYR
jgi:hypothetical protein